MTSPVFRLLDANLNRAAEGLRTLEDYWRFVRDDASAAFDAKTARHAVQSLRVRLDAAAGPGGLRAYRNTPGDVGRNAKTESEGRRPDARAVAEAALGRATQALRTVEEFAKTVDLHAAREAESWRYRLYTWSARLDDIPRDGRETRWRAARTGVRWTVTQTSADAIAAIGADPSDPASWRAWAESMVAATSRHGSTSDSTTSLSLPKSERRGAVPRAIGSSDDAPPPPESKASAEGRRSPQAEREAETENVPDVVLFSADDTVPDGAGLAALRALREAVRKSATINADAIPHGHGEASAGSIPLWLVTARAAAWGVLAGADGIVLAPGDFSTDDARRLMGTSCLALPADDARMRSLFDAPSPLNGS